MSVGLLERPVAATAPETSAGGVPARQAMVRWAWRLFRREWRQQVLILALVVLAVAATVVGAAVAVNTPPPANAGFGSADDMGTFAGSGPHVTTEISSLEQRFGQVDVIDNQTLSVPGSVDTYDLRAQDPNGAFGTPMLSVISGHYPVGPGQVALTPGLATALHLQVGNTWVHDGTARTVVGLVQNPQSLLDAFALVAPGQVTNPTQVTALFDATVSATALGPNFSQRGSAGSSPSGGNALNPDTVVLTLATLGMLLIALVSVGGFTVLAQRRLRAIGMLESMGATDKNVRLVMRANGVIVGGVGALAGFVLGMGLWLAYRPSVEQSAHHLIGAFAVPWVVVLVAMALAVVATTFAAGRPARAITRVPVVSALAGRPAPPKPLHRSAIPGAIVFVIAFLLFGVSGANSRSGGGAPTLVLGLVALIIAIILLAPLALTVVGKFGSRAPVAARLAVRDLARYRSRSGSALAAISLGVLIAVIISGAAASRYGNVLDYAGPNLASNQLIVYTAQSGTGGADQSTEIGPNTSGTYGIIANGTTSTGTPPTLGSQAQTVRGLARALGANEAELDSTNASLNHNGPGRQFDGPIYVATPALLKAYGISPTSINPKADILSMRPGLAGVSDMQLQYGNPTGAGPQDLNGPNSDTTPCPATSCVANPVIQEVGALPAGTSAPNTVITEHAVASLHLQSSLRPQGWLLQSSSPFTATQLDAARQTTAVAGMTVESKNDAPTSGEIINWATVFGIALALGVLAMSVGLVRSETAGDLRTLTATGASSATRRNITAVTAGALGFVGAVLGALAGYIALAGWFRSSQLNGGLSALGHVPWFNLFLLVIAMPLAATAIGWLLAGREPSGIATRPTE